MAQILALVRGVYRNIDGADLVRCEPNQNRLDARVEKRTDPVTLLDPESEQTIGETGRRRIDIGIAILDAADIEENALWRLLNRGGENAGQRLLGGLDRIWVGHFYFPAGVGLIADRKIVVLGQ